MELDVQIAEWRTYVARHAALGTGDVDELEAHLRDQVDDLMRSGLSEDEAFLVAVKRLGSIDALSREFAREHSERLWKQLVLTGDAKGGTARGGLVVAIVLAVASAVAVKVPVLFGISVGHDPFNLYARNIGLFALVPLIAYFAWQRRMGMRRVLTLLVLPTVVLAVAINAFPFNSGDQTFILAAITTPVVLWFVVGLAYVAGEWRSHARRMDFVRFSGEWFIYLVLIALGGGVITSLSVVAFDLLDVAIPDPFEWVLLPGAMGAIVVAAWLVEVKQSVVENMAPVLTRIFTPLTTIMLLTLLVATVIAGRPQTIDRDLLILIDVVLLLVLGLLLYALSARNPFARVDAFDRMQLVLVVLALLVDVLMLSVMLTRIADGGLTPNKVFALGLNLVLAVNLTWAAWLSWGFVRARRPFADIERWQMAYLPVFAAWAAVVVLAFPPLFGFR